MLQSKKITKNKKETLNDEILEFRRPNRLWLLASEFVTIFRATFIFGTSQFQLPIKSYDCLKFFRPKFLKL